MKTVEKNNKTKGSCITRKLKPIFESKSLNFSLKKNRLPKQQIETKEEKSECSNDDVSLRLILEIRFRS